MKISELIKTHNLNILCGTIKEVLPQLLNKDFMNVDTLMFNNVNRIFTCKKITTAEYSTLATCTYLNEKNVEFTYEMGGGNDDIITLITITKK